MLFWLPNNRATPKTVSLRVNETIVVAEIAQTPEEKNRGLSGRTALANDEGMFFINDNDDFHSIWMKDMRFPIDILWLAADGRVVDIKLDAEPESYPEIFRPRKIARYVLEVNAGFSERHSVNIGARIKLPRDLY